MKALLILLWVIPFAICAQVPRPATDLSASKPNNSVGVNQLQPAPASGMPLTTPGPPVVPSNLRDSFEQGRTQGLYEFHDYQIKELLGRVSSLETARTLILGAIAGLAVFAGFLKYFWKRIFRMLVDESTPPKITTSS
jgi:hypothetical protein